MSLQSSFKLLEEGNAYIDNTANGVINGSDNIVIDIIDTDLQQNTTTIFIIFSIIKIEVKNIIILS